MFRILLYVCKINIKKWFIRKKRRQTMMNQTRGVGILKNSSYKHVHTQITPI